MQLWGIVWQRAANAPSHSWSKCFHVGWWVMRAGGCGREKKGWEEERAQGGGRARRRKPRRDIRANWMDQWMRAPGKRMNEIKINRPPLDCEPLEISAGQKTKKKSSTWKIWQLFNASHQHSNIYTDFPELYGHNSGPIFRVLVLVPSLIWSFFDLSSDGFRCQIPTCGSKHPPAFQSNKGKNNKKSFSVIPKLLISCLHTRWRWQRCEDPSSRTLKRTTVCFGCGCFPIKNKWNVPRTESWPRILSSRSRSVPKVKSWRSRQGAKAALLRSLELLWAQHVSFPRVLIQNTFRLCWVEEITKE